jgi:hypothetical protein
MLRPHADVLDDAHRFGNAAHARPAHHAAAMNLDGFLYQVAGNLFVEPAC